MVGTVIEEKGCSDGELVAQSRRGSREAFGRIVRRYQGMIAGTAYSVCGDLHVSEDVAQETFLAAWKSLSGLKEPEKLSPWLCQIARRKALDQQKNKSRGKSRLARLFQMSPGGVGASAAEEALSEEEREMLWRHLSELPQPYRETMVLYYRKEQSTGAVALAMETTEEAVRQRLTRGRAMLREQVAATLERNLARSAPSDALAVSIMAALPAMGAQAATATIGTAAKGAGALSSTLFLWLTVLLGPFVAFSCGIGGIGKAMQSARTTGQRWFIAGFGLAVTVCVGLVYYVYVDSPSFVTHHDRHGYRQLGVMVGITAVGTVIIVLGRRYLNSLAVSAAPEGSLGEESCGPHKMSVWLILTVVLSSVMWMFRLAWIAGDWESFELLCAGTTFLSVAAIYCWRSQSFVVRQGFTFLFVPVLGVLSVLLVNWRMPYWNSVVFHQPQMYPMSTKSLLLMGAFFGCLGIFVIALTGKRGRKVS
jgi:RNA polymerase sigma factor (sigma-70 family)